MRRSSAPLGRGAGPRPGPAVAVTTAAGAVSTTAARTAATAPTAAFSPAAATHHDWGRPAPAYAPYFETWTKDQLPAVARASGARDLTLAFLQTPKRGSCSVAWNGDRKQPCKPGGRYTGQIAKLRAMGGDVIPSFGGYSADQDGTEIADSCPSVPKIARAYESVVTTYGVTRLDMDVEAKSLNKPAGIARRSAALRLLQELGRPDPPPGPDHLHPGRRAVRPARQLPGRAEECGRARRPVHREHHGLRLLHQGQQDGHRHGHRGDPGAERHAPPARAALPRARRGGCGPWRASRCCRASMTSRRRPR